MSKPRTDRLFRLLGANGDVEDDCVYELEREADGDAGHGRFALLQLEPLTGRHWLTTHASLDAVSAYVFGEEVPWETELVLDLDTGDEIHPTGYTWPDQTNNQSKEASNGA